MTTQADIIQLPLWVALFVPVLFFGMARQLYCVLSKMQKSTSRESQKANWSITELGISKTKSLFFRSWDPRVKLLTLFSFCFVVVSLNSILCSAIALLLATGSVWACQVQPQLIVKRLLPLTGILTMFLLLVPFTSAHHPGETLLYFPFLAFPFHLDGFFQAITIALRAVTVALLMIPMFNTASLTLSLQALQQLGVPSSLVQMILLCHRYIFLFQEEATRMYRSMKLRGFSAGTNSTTLRTMGMFLGMLFIRSYERTQHVYEAMLSRGYAGSLPRYAELKTTPTDFLKAAAWLVTGVLLLLFDSH